MSDVRCPYCNAEQEINHDDGYGYDEDRDHEQQCTECSVDFKFTTAISYNYEVFCGEHTLMQNQPPLDALWRCSRCDYYEVRR